MNRYYFILCIALAGAPVLDGQFNASTFNVSGKTYYVSTEATPDGDGSRERPFASLEAARDKIRKEMLETMTPPEGAVIKLLPGTYFLKDTFVLDFKDAFPAYSQLSIEGSGTGESVIHMGKRIPLDQLEPVTDVAALRRLRPEARGHVKVLDLAANGVDLKPLPVLFKGLDGGQPEVYFDDQRLPISRFPNQGHLTMGELISPGVWWDGVAEGGSFRFEDNRHLAWQEAVASGLRLNGFWRIPWQSWSIEVASINAEEGILTHAVPIAEGSDNNSHFAGIGSKYTRPLGSLEEPYFAFNLKEEIDRPGEWSIDYTNAKLYIWLPADSGELVISHKTRPLFELKGASQVNIRNLTFKGGRENGIEIVGGMDNVIEACRFTNLGGWGVIIRGGFRNGVKDSYFTALGKGGIELSGGDPVHLIRCDNFAINNELYDLSHLQKTWAGAIKLGVNRMHGGSIGVRHAVGIRVTDNIIHDLPHIGILAGGNLNEIRRNIIYDIAKITDDVGYIYTRHDMTSRGNIITDNLFYGSRHAHGFHLDDGVSGFLIERNVIIGSKNAVQIGGGHYHVVRNNIMIDCEIGYIVDNRGLSRNYTLKNAKKVAELMITERAPGAWYGQFPELKFLHTDKPEWPKGNSATGNHYVRCTTGEAYLNMSPDIQNYRKIMESRNSMESNITHMPDVVSSDHAELVELFKNYLKKHGVMPSYIPFK